MSLRAGRIPVAERDLDRAKELPSRPCRVDSACVHPLHAAAQEAFEGKVGQLGDDVKIAREGSGQLSVTSSIPFSKRYLKYLTKKFLKKHQMREWLRVVSTDKNTYALKVKHNSPRLVFFAHFIDN